METPPSREEFDALSERVESLANALMTVMNHAVRAQASATVLAIAVGEAFGQICDASRDPEATFQSLVETLEESVSNAMATDPGSAGAVAYRDAMAVIRSSASEALSALLRKRPGHS